jgi:hypothetical protein
VWFFGPYSLTHQILPERKPKPSTNYHRPDVEKDLIFGKNSLMIRPPNFHRNHG